jgi:endonuclease-3 related protein
VSRSAAVSRGGASRETRRRPTSRHAIPESDAVVLPRWFDLLLEAYGPQGWWPGRTRFEIVVGAVLTQGVAWRNVERALAGLRVAGLLTPERMRRAGVREIAARIRPAGYHNQKARALLALLRHLDRRHAGRFDRMLRRPAESLREELLSIRGIGPETADCIILYAARRPVFVVDAYTRRILRRHRLADGDEPYETLRRRFEAELPGDHRIFNEYHALLVRLGKERCRRIPLCSGCPLESDLHPGGPRPD